MDLDKEPHCISNGRWDSKNPYDHWKGGIVEWSANRLELFRSPDQKKRFSGVDGRSLRNLLFKKPHLQPVLNANALEFLKLHQDLIPEWCKRFNLYFWGTIFHESRDHSFVRYLYWDNGWGDSDTLVEGFGWTSRCVALLYRGLVIQE